MIRNRIVCCSFAAIGLCLFVSSSLADPDQGLRIYLPSEKTLTSDVITLGGIAMVLGDPSLTKRADEITLGQFSMPGQEVLIDRQTILSRLAGEGIRVSVHFNGSETIRLRREGHCIEAEQFVSAARACLEKALANEGIESFKLLRTPDPFPLTCKSEGVTLSARLSGNQTDTIRRVTVSVMRNDVQLYQQDVIFTIRYKCRRLVAIHDISAGVPITPENVREETYISNVSPPNEPMLYGMMTRRTIPAGTVVASNLVEPKQPVVLVKRRQKVLLRLETGGLFVSAMGEAMQNGSAGDLIEVKRGSGDEQRIVLGKVMPDGAVEPVL